MNRNLLTDVQFTNETKKIIIESWKKAKLTNSFGANWEFMKYNIRTLAIRRGKVIVKHRQENEEQIIQEIISLSGNCNIDQKKKNKLIQLQLELDKIYEY